jgi:hypothetical protein
MSFKWKERESHYAVLRTRLQSLRAIFSSGASGETYRALFDDFLAKNEFGLALDILCDFLLDPETRPVTETELKDIVGLRVLMEVDDQYFLRLQDKRQYSGNSGSQ